MKTNLIGFHLLICYSIIGDRNMIDRHGIKKIVKDRISNCARENFQQLVWDILIKTYPGLQAPKMVRDMGSDGHIIKEECFFACYAPESFEYDNKDTFDKINKDFAKFTKNWLSTGQFNKWIFVTKRNLKGEALKRITELNQIKDGVRKENWGLENLVNLSMKLSEGDIQEIFDLHSSINKYADYKEQEDKEDSILNQLFDFVIEKLPDDMDSLPEHEKHVKTKAKIKINFKNKKEQEEVNKYFIEAYTRIKQIEIRIQELEPITQQNIQTLITHHYLKLKRDELPNIKILDRLFDFFTPPKQKINPDYAKVVRAFILFYFDDCSIFEKS